MTDTEAIRAAVMDEEPIIQINVPYVNHDEDSDDDAEVDEFEAHFDLADIALNPITTGAGTNIKLFDYFARGLPVVSTPFGIRGIDLEDGTHACIVDLDEFSDTIRQLLESPEQRDRIGEAGRTLVADKYTWETISKRLFARLKTLIK